MGGILSLNAECKCRDSEALQTVLDAAYSIDKNWQALVVIECDRILKEAPSLFDLSGHYYLRHYPGVGSLPMLLIVRNVAIPRIISVKCMGRSIQLVLRMPEKRRPLTCVFSHLAHEDWWQSYADAIMLLPQSRSSMVWQGDLNVNLHAIANSEDSEYRQEHLLRAQAVAEVACDANLFWAPLELWKETGLIGEPFEYSDTIVWHSFSQQIKATTTRRARNLESWLDHTLASRTLKPESGSTWQLAPGDYAWAFVSFAMVLPQDGFAPRPARKWRVADADIKQLDYNVAEALDLARQIELDAGETLTSIGEAIGGLNSIKQHRPRSLASETLSELKRQERVAYSSVERDKLQPLIFAEVARLKRLNREESSAIAMRKQQWWPSRPPKLHKIDSLKIGVNSVTHDSERIRDIIFEEFRGRWHSEYRYEHDILDDHFQNHSIHNDPYIIDDDIFMLALQQIKKTR